MTSPFISGVPGNGQASGGGERQPADATATRQSRWPLPETQTPAWWNIPAGVRELLSTPPPGLEINPWSHPAPGVYPGATIEKRLQDAMMRTTLALSPGNAPEDIATYIRRGGLPALAGRVGEMAPDPSATLRDIGERLRKGAGFTHQRLPDVTDVDPIKGKQMADIYHSLRSEPENPLVQGHYRGFVAETQRQAELLKMHGYSWEFVGQDPYRNSKEMLADLKNKHIKVLKTDPSQAHPLLTPDENNTFRAVHDILGHGTTEASFGPRGEEQAFRNHAALYSPSAQRVLATETRGQNSWFNFGPHAQLEPRERPSPQQKAALWPNEYLGDYPTMPKGVAETRWVTGPAVRVPNEGGGWDIHSLPFEKGTHTSVLDMMSDKAPSSAAYYEQLGRAEDGFVNDQGKWLTREEAYKLAEENGQLIPGRGEAHSFDINAPLKGFERAPGLADLREQGRATAEATAGEKEPTQRLLREISERSRPRRGLLGGR